MGEKSQILKDIVGQIRLGCGINKGNGVRGGGFVKQDPATKRWFDVGDNLAKEKISKAFRDELNRRNSRDNKDLPQLQTSLGSTPLIRRVSMQGRHQQLSMNTSFSHNSSITSDCD